jgi:hypothetical protein
VRDAPERLVELIPFFRNSGFPLAQRQADTTANPFATTSRACARSLVRWARV